MKPVVRSETWIFIITHIGIRTNTPKIVTEVVWEGNFGEVWNLYRSPQFFSFGNFNTLLVCGGFIMHFEAIAPNPIYLVLFFMTYTIGGKID